jgi:hypothetical protein
MLNVFNCKLCRSMRIIWFLSGGLVLAFVLAACASPDADTMADRADKPASTDNELKLISPSNYTGI